MACALVSLLERKGNPRLLRKGLSDIKQRSFLGARFLR
jgi:hypothetical protein